MKRVFAYLTKQRNISILWKHMMMMLCILVLAVLALIINNRQSIKTLTSDNIGKFQITLDRDCALLGETMYRTIAIPAGVEGTRYYDYIKSVNGGFLEDKYYPVLKYVRNALNNQLYLQKNSSMALLYMPGCGSIVTNDKVFPVADDCFEKHIKFSQTGKETILGFLRERKSVTFLPVQPVKFGSNDYQPCLAHIVHPSDSNLAVMSIYTLETVLETLGYNHLPKGSGLRITQTDGLLLLQYPETSSDYPEEDFYRLESTLAPYDIQVSIWIPKDSFKNILKPVYVVGVLTIFSFTILGFALSFLLSRVSVRPLRELLSAHGLGHSQGHYNEIEGIDHLLRSSREQTVELQRRLIDQIMSGVFSGVVLSEREELILKEGLDPFPETFRVAIMHTTPQINSVLGIRIKTLFPDILWVSMNQRETGILFPGTDEDVDKLTKEVDKLNSQLANDQTLCCGISGIARDLGSLRAAVRQARTALPQKGGAVLFPEKRIDSCSMSWLRQERLYKSIFSNDEESALKLLQEMMLLADNANVHEIFYNVRFVLRSAAEEMELMPLIHWDTEYSPNMLARENMQVLEAMLGDLFRKNEEKRTQKSSSRREKIMEYIQSNYSNYQLCASTVATEFMLSEKRVYEIVREKTGMSFNEYLLQLRMKQAAMLLVTTHESVNDIADRCGYQGSSTFYRVFKRHYGVAPGKFREGGTDTQHDEQK